MEFVVLMCDCVMYRYQILFGLLVELLAYVLMVALIGGATSGEYCVLGAAGVNALLLGFFCLDHSRFYQCYGVCVLRACVE